MQRLMLVGWRKMIKREITMNSTRELNEPVLPDDYPIYADYFYVADGKVIRGDWHRIDVKQLKLKLKANEIRRCDFVGRGLL
jgi:hypothetical protein